MKKMSTKISTIMIISSLLILSGCNEKKNQDTSSGSSSIVSKSPSYSKAETVMLYSGWTLYEENNEGKMIATEETTTGTAVSLISKDGIMVSKNAIRKLQNGKEEAFDFVMIEYNGKEYWTRDIFVAKNGGPAIVTTDEVRLYSTPDLASVTKKTLKYGDMVAFTEETADFDGITIYSTEPFGKVYYVKKGSVSTDEGMIDNMLVEKRIADLGDKIKPEVLEELMSITR